MDIRTYDEPIEFEILKYLQNNNDQDFLTASIPKQYLLKNVFQHHNEGIVNRILDNYAKIYWETQSFKITELGVLRLQEMIAKEKDRKLYRENVQASINVSKATTRLGILTAIVLVVQLIVSVLQLSISKRQERLQEQQYIQSEIQKNLSEARSRNP